MTCLVRINRLPSTLRQIAVADRSAEPIGTHVFGTITREETLTMSTLTDRFSTEFREEHRAVRDALFDLVDAFAAHDHGRAPELVTKIAGLCGPHFRYEEETMYPLLVATFGVDYVTALYRDHDGAIANAGRLAELAGLDTWTNEDVAESARLVQAILPHVSDCDGLSIMVERLDDAAVESIFAKRAETLAANVDLLTWAAQIRYDPQLAAA